MAAVSHQTPDSIDPLAPHPATAPAESTTAARTSCIDHARPYPQAVRRVRIPACEVKRGDLVADDGWLRVVILDPIADEIMGVQVLRIHFGDGGDMPTLPSGTVTVFRLEY